MECERYGRYLEGTSLERAAQWLTDQGIEIPSTSSEIAEIIDGQFDGGLHWFIASQFSSAADPSGKRPQH